MKNQLLIIAAALLMSSCVMTAPINVREAKILSIGVDYSEFSEAGFFITESNSVSFDYKTLGSVSSYVQSGGKNGSYIYTRSKDLQVNQVIMTPRDAIRKLYDEAKKLGANGLINVKVRRIPDYITSLNDGYEATGMAIFKN